MDLALYKINIIIIIYIYLIFNFRLIYFQAVASINIQYHVFV